MAKRYDTVTIICDECGQETCAPLDHEHVQASATMAWITDVPDGWHLTNGKDFCPECEAKLNADI
jgi:hypothetical protein